MSIDMDFARRDDCMDSLVPSDLRMIIGERDVALGQVGDLSMLVRQLVHALRKAAPDHALPAKAVDYLKRKGLQGSPMRSPAQSSAGE
ncbi:hypothetical protein [Pseudomonas sp.]|jgi:hypothetical protein|uniref:hypothetical protein n=1 Tax=Pseudomonas sp. TaxID=306 RepID=UPI00257CAAD1|nr:hypothetical protein [Pseudomonas sp.]